MRGDPLPPVELVANPTDKTSNFAKGFSAQPQLSMPLFCNAKCTGDTSISFPFMFYSQFGGAAGDMTLALYEERFQQLAMMGTQMPWAQKTPKMFFSASNVRGYREQLLQLTDPNMHLVPENVELSRYGQFQYLVYAFGHSGWSRRLRELALIEAVILMENSSCHEFFAHLYEPHKHFIPVAEDLSDLPEKLAAAMANPAASAAMAREWLQIGQLSMTLECILDYIEHLLRAYAALQRFTPVEHTDWPEWQFDSGIVYFHDARPPDPATCRRFF